MNNPLHIHDAPEPVVAVGRECFVYGQTIVWIAEFVRRRARAGELTEEQWRAQVEKDLKQVLDQKWEPF